MKLKLILPIFLLFSILTHSSAVNTTLRLNDKVGIKTNTSFFQKAKHLFSQTVITVKKTVANQMKRANLLDKPKRIIILALVGIAAGILLTLLGNVIMLSFIGTLAWLLYLFGFGMVILWIYTILIRA